MYSSFSNSLVASPKTVYLCNLSLHPTWLNEVQQQEYWLFCHPIRTHLLPIKLALNPRALTSPWSCPSLLCKLKHLLSGSACSPRQIDMPFSHPCPSLFLHLLSEVPPLCHKSRWENVNFLSCFLFSSIYMNDNCLECEHIELSRVWTHWVQCYKWPSQQR